MWFFNLVSFIILHYMSKILIMWVLLSQSLQNLQTKGFLPDLDIIKCLIISFCSERQDQLDGTAGGQRMQSGKKKSILLQGWYLTISQKITLHALLALVDFLFIKIQIGRINMKLPNIISLFMTLVLFHLFYCFTFCSLHP